MTDIKSLTFPELQNFVVSIGFKKYRTSQIAKWLYKKLATSFDEMTDISKKGRKILKENAEIYNLKIVNKEVSKDGTIKYLFELKDGNRIETVFIPERDWNTICVSTQVGCPIGCKFCFTAKDGFTRNLTTSEIVDQYLSVQRDVGIENRISNVVFMGMGEPLLNFENVKKSIEILTDDRMIGLSKRKITVSTCGIIPGIKKMAKEMPKIKLALSLHATEDETRENLIPLNKKYSIREIMKELKNYPADNIRRIMIEYLMLEGINDSPEDAVRLSKLVKGIPVKVNLIPFNQYPGSSFKTPSREKIEAFQKILWDRGIATFIRDSRGQDISAACGMLRGKDKETSKQ
ncbi:23S rRNA (adenine(2503)-C(2))-methyltransferase RlmN [Desulfurobacterium indicum]|uniref:Probable dual-specificity RNA methyltransferase RlmN n=1 Tax=Desulfurobacterium indicum TaxID=1914305 RepID=A0A1R1MN23_9BACT|nr:23S rRNA (adenine(2503)-C(2))-methyltransferase RlmN [Desulfurobacterium indicum]OMH41177.1 23S rRNA (adenine(2503)-C(2))-methyltransferase [Desulfurobacterium indicum]